MTQLLRDSCNALTSIGSYFLLVESLAMKLRLYSGRDKVAFEESFSFGCPKFLSPVAPNFDAGPLNSHKEPMMHQCKVRWVHPYDTSQ